jgi:Flp pilus assembly protein TadG
MSTRPTPRILAAAIARRLPHRVSHDEPRRISQLGQVLPLFVLLSVVILGGAALLTDVAWWWTYEQRAQRAADAAALAGAIYLPGNQGRAYSTALAEAAKNGFVNGSGGVTVTPRRDLDDPRKLIVDVDGHVDTHFARVFCWDGGPCLTRVDVGVTGAANYVLPVPMGSPQNYYGVGYLIDAVTTTTTTQEDRDTGWRTMTAPVSGTWSGTGNVASNNDQYATATQNNAQQSWRFSMGIPNDPSVVIQGVQVRLTDVSVTNSAPDCRVAVAASWDGGSSWTTTSVQTPTLPTSANNDASFGSDSNPTWAGRTWARTDFANFQIRLTRAGVNCPQPPPSSRPTVRLDLLEVRVDYRIDVTTTTTVIQPTDVLAPTGGVLAPQNFWGALQSQGAPNIQGDAYMTYYDTRTSAINDDYRPETYY